MHTVVITATMNKPSASIQVSTQIILNTPYNVFTFLRLCNFFINISLNFYFFCLVPFPPTVTISPPGPIQGAMVGSPQMIQCIANTTTVLHVNMVMFTWIKPGGDIITNDSRVTINPTTSSGNTYTSSIQFSYLMEGDEGTYMCNVTTFGITGSALVVLEPLNGN